LLILLKTSSSQVIFSRSLLVLLVAAIAVVMAMSHPERIKDQINRRLDGLFRENEDGELQPHVYIPISCNKFVDQGNLDLITLQKLHENSHNLKPASWNHVLHSLAACYTCSDDYMNDGNGARDWIEDMLLSPKAS
jgi:hypothetical protein